MSPHAAATIAVLAHKAEFDREQAMGGQLAGDFEKKLADLRAEVAATLRQATAAQLEREDDFVTSDVLEPWLEERLKEVEARVSPSQSGEYVTAAALEQQLRAISEVRVDATAAASNDVVTADGLSAALEELRARLDGQQQAARQDSDLQLARAVEASVAELRAELAAAMLKRPDDCVGAAALEQKLREVEGRLKASAAEHVTLEVLDHKLKMRSERNRKSLHGGATAAHSFARTSAQPHWEKPVVSDGL